MQLSIDGEKTGQIKVETANSKGIKVVMNRDLGVMGSDESIMVDNSLENETRINVVRKKPKSPDT